MEILGSGTSHGIPVVSCECPVCASNDPKDTRTRASALFRDDNGLTVIVDAGPEFRVQALRAKVRRLDALLLTHAHADHIHGLDDVRIFTHFAPLSVYGNGECLEDLRTRFDYIFKRTQEGGGKPHLNLVPVASGDVIRVGNRAFTAIGLTHGELPVLGWRCGDTAYLTDCDAIPPDAEKLLSGVKNLVIDALRPRQHSTHFNFSGALEAIDTLRPQRAWFTHICHDMSNEGIISWLQENSPGKKIEPAWDGLRIEVGIEPS